MHSTIQRLAIRLPDGRSLAVPPMRPGLPSAVRQRVFELVLTGQYSDAYDLALEGAEDMRDAGRIAHPQEHARVRSILSRLPAPSRRRRMAA